VVDGQVGAEADDGQQRDRQGQRPVQPGPLADPHRGGRPEYLGRADRLHAALLRVVLGEELRAGIVYIAPGGMQTEVQRSDGGLSARITPADDREIYAPSVDRLLESASACVGDALIAVIMTGMGDDGARGIRTVRQRGGKTIAESEETAIIFGMPNEAIKTGCIDQTLPLTDIAEAIERHHTRQAEGMAAVIRLGDMVVAHIEDSPVGTQDLVEAAETCGMDEQAVRMLLYELPQGKGSRRRATGPCPLSSRELDVLRRLAEGKVYKQIAHELTLSTSTVRTHLHNIYGKLGAVDRAQAVLSATERGWL